MAHCIGRSTDHLRTIGINCEVSHVFDNSFRIKKLNLRYETTHCSFLDSSIDSSCHYAPDIVFQIHVSSRIYPHIHGSKYGALGENWCGRDGTDCLNIDLIASNCLVRLGFRSRPDGWRYFYAFADPGY